MRGHLIFAEAATPHPDGTISMLRVGLDRFRVRSVPVTIECFAVTRLTLTADDAGQHEVVLRMVDGNDKRVLQDSTTTFSAPAQDGRINIINRVRVAIERHGKFKVTLTVDGKELDQLSLFVEPAPQGARA